MLCITIVNRETGNYTHYKPAELRRIAALNVKGRGKLTYHWVSFDQTTGSAALVAQYLQPDNWSGSINIAL